MHVFGEPLPVDVEHAPECIKGNVLQVDLVDLRWACERLPRIKSLNFRIMGCALVFLVRAMAMPRFSGAQLDTEIECTLPKLEMVPGKRSPKCIVSRSE